jgi:hypothetical protein
LDQQSRSEDSSSPSAFPHSPGSDDSSSGEKNPRNFPTIGVALGALVAILLIIGGVLLFARCRRQSEATKSDHTSEVETDLMGWSVTSGSIGDEIVPHQYDNPLIETMVREGDDIFAPGEDETSKIPVRRKGQN